MTLDKASEAIRTRETPVQVLYREWEAVRTAGNGVSEEECDAAIQRMQEIEEQLSELASQSISDLAAKVAVKSSWGDWGLPDHDDRFWDEFRKLLT